MSMNNREAVAKTHGDTLQFRLLLAIAFAWFFTAAIGSKLLMRKPAGWVVGDSCFSAAKRSAYNVVPFVFARV